MARLAEGQYIKMRKATEDMILKSTKDEFIRFILENAVVEEDEDEEACFIPSGEHEFVWGKTYEMQGEEFKGDEFIITNDGRVFFALSLNTNWEVVDDVKKETKDETHPTLYWVKKGDRAVRCESKEAAFEAYVRMGKTEVTIEKHFWDSDVEGRMKEYTLTFTKMTRRTLKSGELKYYLSSPVGVYKEEEAPELSEEVKQEIKEQESKGNKFVKIDKNGSRHYRGKVECERCQGRGWYAVGVLNGQLVPARPDNAECYACKGAGWVWNNLIIRTPEYEAKLAEQRTKRAEAKAEETARKQKEEWEQNHLKSLKDNGFNPEGQTWVFLGNTYSIKDTLKEMGARFSWELGWHIDHEVEGYETMTLNVSEVATADDWGRIHYTITKAEADQKKQEALQKLHPTEVSEYVGQVKDRLTMTLTFTGTAHWEVDTTKQFWNGRWGREQTRDVYLHKFKDEHGNIFTWKTSDPLGYWDEHGQWVHIDEGTQVTIKGTVKEHSEYKGIKQTVLTRCKVA